MNHLKLLAIGLLLLSCQKTNPDKTETEEVSIFEVTLKTSGTDYNIQNRQAKVVLMAIPESLADAKAYQIYTGNVEIPTLPHTISIAFDDLDQEGYEAHFEEPLSGAEYFLVLLWDSDDNGTSSCQGDLIIDFGQQFPFIHLDAKQTIYLTTATDISCTE